MSDKHNELSGRLLAISERLERHALDLFYGTVDNFDPMAADMELASKLINELHGERVGPDDEPLVWEATTPCYIKYVTDSRYHKFSEKVRKWYRPICPKCGPSVSSGTVLPLGPKPSD